MKMFGESPRKLSFFQKLNFVKIFEFRLFAKMENPFSFFNPAVVLTIGLEPFVFTLCLEPSILTMGFGPSVLTMGLGSYVSPWI
jgi:hypothetical protein